MSLQQCQGWSLLSFLFHVIVLVYVSTVHVHAFAPSATSTATRFTRPLPLLLAQNNNDDVDKGFNILGIASKVVPQGLIVQTAKESWKFVWKVSLKLRVRVSRRR
jgi:hypothetical protein